MNDNSAQNDKRIIQAWADAARSDDIEAFFDEFIDADCEWVMMATGETFRGIDEVRQMALRSRDARKHTEEAHIEFTNAFSSEDQSQICIECDHGAIITEEGARLFGMPATAGRRGDVKICHVCHVKNGKLDRVHEYFDTAGLIGGTGERRLYS